MGNMRTATTEITGIIANLNSIGVNVINTRQHL